MINNLIKSFDQSQDKDLTDREQIVERLLREGKIDTREATVLLKTVIIELNANELQLSSGAKIVGGSDFERNDYGR